MKKYKWVQRAICFIIGHDVEWVIEHRLRFRLICLNRKGGKKRNQSRWVAGAYKKCSRCGKKLSNFERIWGGWN